jgi:hypothetical protein
VAEQGGEVAGGSALRGDAISAEAIGNRRVEAVDRAEGGAGEEGATEARQAFVPQVLDARNVG